MLTGIAGYASSTITMTMKPAMSPAAPPKPDKSIASPRNNADLMRALAYRNRHDREYADPAHEQRDAAERCHADRQHVQDRAEHIQHLLLRRNRKILAAMPREQHAANAGDYLVDGRVLVVEHVDLVQTLAVEQRETAGGWNIDGVV